MTKRISFHLNGWKIDQVAERLLGMLGLPATNPYFDINDQHIRLSTGDNFALIKETDGSWGLYTRDANGISSKSAEAIRVLLIERLSLTDVQIHGPYIKGIC